MRYREITKTNLINISSVDISCDIIPPGSKKIVEVSGVDIVIHVLR